MQCMFFEHNGIKLELSDRRKFGKFTNMWKSNTPKQPMDQRRNQKEIRK